MGNDVVNVMDTEDPLYVLDKKKYEMNTSSRDICFYTTLIMGLLHHLGLHILIIYQDRCPLLHRFPSYYIELHSFTESLKS